MTDRWSASEGEASKVTGVFLNQMFGNRIKFGHVKCLVSDGVRTWDTCNTQTQSKYQAKNKIITELSDNLYWQTSKHRILL